MFAKRGLPELWGRCVRSLHLDSLAARTGTRSSASRCNAPQTRCCICLCRCFKFQSPLLLFGPENFFSCRSCNCRRDLGPCHEVDAGCAVVRLCFETKLVFAEASVEAVESIRVVGQGVPTRPVVLTDLTDFAQQSSHPRGCVGSSLVSRRGPEESAADRRFFE